MNIRTCVVYRTNAKLIKSDIEKRNYNNGDVPQFEACIFSDGTVSQRWLTGNGSTAVWNKWDDLKRVHIDVHPDYGTRIVWSDGMVEEL